MKITSIVLMNEQLRLTIDDLGDGDDHLKLFFGFAADEIANMKEVKGLDLGKDVVKWIGSGRDAVPVFRRVRKRSTDLV